MSLVEPGVRSCQLRLVRQNHGEMQHIGIIPAYEKNRPEPKSDGKIWFDGDGKMTYKKTRVTDVDEWFYTRWGISDPVRMLHRKAFDIRRKKQEEKGE